MNGLLHFIVLLVSNDEMFAVSEKFFRFRRYYFLLIFA